MLRLKHFTFVQTFRKQQAVGSNPTIGSETRARKAGPGLNRACRFCALAANRTARTRPTLEPHSEAHDEAFRQGGYRAKVARCTRRWSRRWRRPDFIRQSSG